MSFTFLALCWLRSLQLQQLNIVLLLKCKRETGMGMRLTIEDKDEVVAFNELYGLLFYYRWVCVVAPARSSLQT